MDEIRNLAIQVFGTEEAADFWLQRLNPELGGRSPAEIIAAGGITVVRDFLEGLLEGEYG